MTWPQWTVAIALLLSLVAGAARLGSSNELSPGAVSFWIIFEIAWAAAFVMVLHAGGFW